VLDVLRRLVPVLLRHLVAYGELLSDEAVDALRELRRQLIGFAVLCTAGGVAALMGCVWIIGATWDGPHRLQAIGAMTIGFALLAASGAWYACSGRPPGRPRPFERLHTEWREDLRQLAALYPSLAGVDPSAAAGELHGD
jgi:hypothetical protein